MEEVYESFAFVVQPEDLEKRGELLENLKLGRFKDFAPELMVQAVDHYHEHKSLPKLFCQDVTAVLPTADKNNFKVLAHVARCVECSNKVS